MVGRLRDATSPYLLQHAGNPVDWWPWGDDAFAAARERDVPVLLSVGYSACHWCHVMAHESFEDPETARLINENLVPVKVDREERPDVDAIYLTATQAMTGQAGWPMTAFLTPDREPIWCGTYLPRDYLQRLVTSVARAWRESRAAVVDRANQVAQALSQHSTVPRPAAGTGGLEESARAAVDRLAAEYDADNGGFGGAPKFPPSMVLEFLLRHAVRASSDSISQPALEMVVGTAEAMARGGMYDQLGGGFARYATDARWIVPHFEKMLYDNALLARVYAHLWRRTGSELARRVALETCDWVIFALRTPEGGFGSALDADSGGVEGAFYVWTPGELAEVLGPEDGLWAAGVFGVTAAGTFEGGKWVLQRRAVPGESERLERARAALVAARARRVPPGRDDKVVAAWNGLAIAALAETGLTFNRPELIAAARAAAELLATVHLTDGVRPRLARTSRDGVVGPSAGVLEDYGCVAEGLLVLAGVTGEARWYELAERLLGTALDRFGDGAGGFYDTADDAERLIYRPVDPADGPSPSGTFAVAGALLSYAALSGSARHRDAALSALSAVPALAARFPRAAGWGLAVAEAALVGPAEVAVVGPRLDERTHDLLRTALLAAPPGTVLALGDPGTVESPAVGGNPVIPLLAGRGLVAGHPAAYVCRHFACRAPLTDPGALRAELSRPPADMFG